MFDSINGLPLHPLATHAAVVLIPLAGLLGLLFAVPRTRAWATVPLPLVSLAAAAATFVSLQSGEALQRAGGVGATGLGGPALDLVEEHSRLADQLHVLAWVYAGIAVLAAGLARATRRRTGGLARDFAIGSVPGAATVASARPSRLVSALAALLVVGAVLLGVQTYRVGEAGSRAVWNPTGAVDYSADR